MGSIYGDIAGKNDIWNPDSKDDNDGGLRREIGKHESAADITALYVDSLSLGQDIGAAIADPLGALVSCGLDFLLDICHPLQALLNLVTGNATALGNESDKWKDRAQELLNQGQEVATAAQDNLSMWTGTAATAARSRLVEFNDGLQELSLEISALEALLQISAAIMDTAQALIKDIISQFVEWLIITWLAAQAAAVETLGASEAVAAGATEAEAAVATSRATRIVEKITSLLRRVWAILQKILTSIRRIGGKFANSKFGGKVIQHARDDKEWGDFTPPQTVRAAARSFPTDNIGKDARSSIGQDMLKNPAKNLPKVAIDPNAPWVIGDVNSLLNPDTPVQEFGPNGAHQEQPNA